MEEIGGEANAIWKGWGKRKEATSKGKEKENVNEKGGQGNVGKTTAITGRKSEAPSSSPSWF